MTQGKTNTGRTASTKATAGKKRGLGRGLDALLGMSAQEQANAEAGLDMGLKQLPIDVLQRGRFQPRMDIKSETLEELAESIRSQGVVQPIVVRALGDGGRYEIIAGERRWRAAMIAGLEQVPAVIREVPDRVAMSMAIIENMQREDLNPIEEAAALKRLVEEFGLTHEQVGEAVGRSRTAVSNMIRLLELDESVRRMLEAGDIEMGHARALLTLPPLSQAELANEIIRRSLSVRDAENLARERRESKPGENGTEKVPKEAAKDPDIARLEQRLVDTLGAKVQFKARAGGKGSVTIHYNSLEELDGILSHIR